MSSSVLPAWLDPLTSAAGQRSLDAWAIEQAGIPGVELMERAGSGLALRVGELVPDGPVAVVCGKGNNGGDGFVVARLLAGLGREVHTLILAEPREYRGDAAANLARLAHNAPEPFTTEALDGAAVIVDALLGTGFDGKPREPYATAIRAINAARSHAFVVACDVPSGVDASSGEIAGEAVHADATVTFHAAKPGLWIAPGKACAGLVEVIDIGIPPSDEPIAPAAGVITEAVLGAVPRRGTDATKFTAGAVLVCGGSQGLTGAPLLAALGAMRAGAGYVTVAAAASLTSILHHKPLEVMSVELPEVDGELGEDAITLALERAARVQSVILGPGLGREPAAAEFARRLARQAATPLVLDADGLNAHAGAALAGLRRRTAPTVLTPHAGELARMLQLDSESVSARRLHHAREAAAQSGAIVVLKGDDTLVVDPDGRVAVSPGGAPALATAGTGDVLSGVLGAHLAKGLDPFTAACAAVQVHLMAGRRAAAETGPEGVIATDVIAQLPAVLRAGNGG